MKIQLPNKAFYSRHNDEIKRFTTNNKSLHIINSKSKNKIHDKLSEKLFLDFENGNINVDNLIGKYDVIVLTDIVESHPDIFVLFKKLSMNLNSNGKLIVTSLNSKYNLVIKILEFFNLKDTNVKHSYIHNKKIRNITSGLNYEYITSFSKQIFPFKLIGLGTLLNKFLESLLYFFNLGIKTYSVFRIQSKEKNSFKKTIIIPAKNEEGNLQKLIDRIPKNENYEIIIPCGLSEDKTVEVAENLSKNENFFNVKTFVQSGKGKANAVWEALIITKGEVVAILDADISVDPETIPEFFEIIDKNNADFVNGTRLIYQMEKGSMRYINHLGNRIFQYFVSKIINQPLTDSLCGTKVFRKELFENILWWQNTSKSKDPFGDFDLIFTAAYTGQKIIEYPIHYRTRTYGTTQISRFKDGFKLAKYLLKSFFVFNTSRN